MSISITALVDPDVTPAGRRLAWLASNDDGVPVGSAFLRLFAGSGQDQLGELTIHVHPAERRKRVASKLLESVVDAATRERRRSILIQADAQSSAEAFVRARGFSLVLSLINARLPLATANLLELQRIVRDGPAGYRLISWTGVVPDKLAETFVASRRAMDDMPTGAMDYGTVTWDLKRVRAAAAAVQKRGDLLHTVAAISEADDAVAGFSELVVPGGETGDGQHYSTGVLPEHRGHGLGLWMKAAAVVQIRERYPSLAGLLTDTADGNTHMRRINDALGYEPTHTTYEYQLDLPAPQDAARSSI